MALKEEFEQVHVPEGPPGVAVAQDEEWFDVSINGERRRIQFHDYAAIYDVPGLYERLFYDQLRCTSPKTVVGLLEAELGRGGTDPGSLVVLDLGAGNGMVGEELDRIGVRAMVGVDLLPEAAAATERDRPGLYDEYVVADFTELAGEQRSQLAARAFNCLISVAALGFGDIPPEALAAAYDLVEPGGWIALTIKEDFLTTLDPSGFERLLRRMLEEEMLDLKARERYRHRLSSNGDGLYYIAMIARKVDDRRLIELVAD